MYGCVVTYKMFEYSESIVYLNDLNFPWIKQFEFFMPAVILNKAYFVCNDNYLVSARSRSKSSIFFRDEIKFFTSRHEQFFE